MESQEDEVALVRLRFDLMARIGVTLLDVQVTEQALRLVTTFVLQKSSPLTAEKLMAQTSAEQKKTLGYFLAELRKRADIDFHFDRTLAEFLRRRNQLAHNLSELPGWNTDTFHGIYIARCFINELHEMNNVVLKVLTGLMRVWQAQGGFALPEIPGDFLKEVDEKYVPLIDNLFSAKETE